MHDTGRSERGERKGGDEVGHLEGVCQGPRGISFSS